MAQNEPQRKETRPGPSPNSPSLLFEYQCRSGKFIRLANRIESKLSCPNWNALMCCRPTAGERALGNRAHYAATFAFSTSSLRRLHCFCKAIPPTARSRNSRKLLRASQHLADYYNNNNNNKEIFIAPSGRNQRRE